MNNNKQSLILFIIIFVILAYILFRLPSLEQMTNVDKATEDKIRDVYKIDTDAIRNLSNLAKDLTVNGKLKVPGGLEVDGAFNIIPKGSIIAWNGATAPAGWALCDGSNGTPDLRGRFILGLGQGTGLTNRPINQKGGAETHTLSVNEIPAHNHTMNTAGSHTHSVNNPFGTTHRYDNKVNFAGGARRYGYPVTITLNASGNHTHTINNTGGGQAHNNMPPFHVLAYIMKL